MFNWLTRFKKADYVPHYSALRTNASRGLPTELEQQEGSESFRARRESLQEDLLDGGQRPSIEAPLFTMLINSDGNFVALTLPDDARCIPVFSTPFRAADYIRALLNRGPRLQYLCSTSIQFLQMARDFEDSGIEWITIDRCPRCSDVSISAIGVSSIKAPDDAVVLWAIHKAGELARAELYCAFALESARAGKLELARDVALEAVGHVTMEDPRLHLLLGKIAIARGDGRLLSEAKAFLEFFGMGFMAPQAQSNWRVRCGRLRTALSYMLTQLSKYRVIKKIGAGGMGQVYLAEDPLLMRAVAIKVISKNARTAPDAEIRFLREARAISALNHPNVITIYEVGETDEQAYIVMEYVKGRSLGQLISAQEMKADTIFDIALQICDALIEAHSQNIIHRDIKPENILVSERGQVKLVDFGLAKRFKAISTNTDGAALMQSLTESGAVVGTLCYMSPEQLYDKQLDERTDIFSFGIVLYKMITGKFPF